MPSRRLNVRTLVTLRMMFFAKSCQLRARWWSLRVVTKDLKYVGKVEQVFPEKKVVIYAFAAAAIPRLDRSPRPTLATYTSIG